MHPIDVKTIMFLYALNGVLCCGIMAFFWVQNRARSRAFALWVSGHFIQLVGFILIALRGAIPDSFSIVGATALILLGTQYLLMGLERYAGNDSLRVADYTVLALITCGSVAFTYGWESIAARNILFSVGIVYYAARMAILAFVRVGPKLKSAIRPVGVTALALIAVNGARIANNAVYPENRTFFDFGPVNVGVLVANELIALALVFSIVLMVSRRLHDELKDELVERTRVTDELWRSKDRFTRAFQMSPNAIIISVLATGEFVEVNDAFLAMTGFTRAETLGKTAFSLNFWDVERDRDLVVAALTRGDSVHERELRFRKKDGTVMDCLFSSQLLELEQGRCILSTIQDISARKAADAELARNRDVLARERQRLAYILEGTNAGTCEWDIAKNRMTINDRWARIAGLSPELLDGLTIERWFELVHPDDRDAVRSALDRHLRGDDPAFDCEFRLFREDGQAVWVLDRGKIVSRGAKGEPVLMCGTRQEITDRKRDEETILHMATHDPLTNLPTLRLARDRLEMAAAIAKRQKRPMATLFVDIDGFKAINDTWGHDAGDRVLKEIAARLASSVRESDTAARIGGDEFLVVLSNLASRDDAALVARKMLDAFARPIGIAEGDVAVGLSVGIAVYPDDGAGPDELIKAADGAMYRVKRAGKNNYGFAEHR
jgi:diguanylate cyclase (GGDEF)-like protein/PAS domain S-box-containing protein